MSQQSENAITIYGATPAKQPRAADAPLPMDEPAMDTSAEAITIDLTAIETRIEPPQTDADTGAVPNPGGAEWQKHAPLAASLGIAAIVGALAGATGTAALAPATTAAPAAAASFADETRALQDRLTRLSGEVSAVKAGIEAGQRAATAQINRINERLERADKAQSEPAAKLARIAETVERLERRALAAAAEVTGSVTSIEKQQPKPAVLEGWTLRDYYAGRAVLESRNGRIYEVGPGSSLPGVGPVETIKRIDGKVVVTTAKGVISSSIEPPRRPAYYMPRGF